MNYVTSIAASRVYIGHSALVAHIAVDRREPLNEECMSYVSEFLLSAA